MVALLAQTTLSHDEWAGIVDRARERFPDLWMPNRSDLCFATTNRQAALKALAGRCDAVVVIGSENSSNTVALTKVAEAFGCPRVVRVNDASELPDDLSGTVGVTAGASAPEALVEAVVARLAPVHGWRARPVTVEEEYFPPPPELRELLRGLEVGARRSSTVLPDDDGPAPVSRRRPATAAADVLEQIAHRPRRTARPSRPRHLAATAGSDRSRPISRVCARCTMTTSFTSMDTSTAEQWGVIGAETMANQGRVADRVLAMLESLSDVVDGFAVDQLTHCLQTATRAERAGADDEVVVASLCHDIGKAVSVPNHPRIAAEILRPYVRAEVTEAILYHQDFQGRHYFHHFDMDPNLRDNYRDQPWYDLAERFADEWDQTSFDPDYPTEPLAHFEPKVRAVFASAALALMAPTQRHRWLTLPDSAAKKRSATAGATSWSTRPGPTSPTGTRTSASAPSWPSSPPTTRRPTSAPC